MQRRRDLSTYERLPEDLLDQFLNELELLSDFIKFGVVCKTWYNVFLQRKRHRIEQCNNEVPLLLISIEDNKGNSSSIISNTNIITPSPNQIFNIFDKGNYDSMSPPVIKNINLAGEKWSAGEKVISICSYGYLATTTINEMGKIIMSLNNPVTGHTISLPPLSEHRLHRVYKVVLSCNPCIYADKCVVAYLYSSSRIRCMRLGSNKWSKYQVKSRSKIGSIIFHKGQLYVVNEDWDLFAIGCFWESNNGDNGDFQTCDIVGTGACYSDGIFMVESLRGELLMIVTTRLFKVYKRVTTINGDGNKKGHWVQIRRLDEGEVLFCSGLYPNYLNAICSRCTHLKPHSIYLLVGKHSMYVYSLNEERKPDKHVLDVGKLENRCTQPYWINPALQ